MGSEWHDFGHSEACDGCIRLPPFIEEPEHIQLLCCSCHYGYGHVETVFHEQGYIPTEIKIHEDAAAKVHSLFFPV